MALGTAVIGLLPTYASIGIAAPILLVICRIAQGLALGGETTGTTSFILESAPEDRRGGWIGLTLIFSHLPNALVAILLIGLQLAAGATSYADWVWRVPFLAGDLSASWASGCGAISTSRMNSSKRHARHIRRILFLPRSGKEV